MRFLNDLPGSAQARASLRRIAELEFEICCRGNGEPVIGAASAKFKSGSRKIIRRAGQINGDRFNLDVILPVPESILLYPDRLFKPP